MNRYLNLLVIAIALATVVSGLVQIFVPSFVLHFIGAEVNASTRYFFAIIGMFMALFGGLMLHTVYTAESSKVAVFWAALQKLGASVAIGIGVFTGVLSIIAGAVALFDLLSGILFLYYLKTMRSGEAA